LGTNLGKMNISEAITKLIEVKEAQKVLDTFLENEFNKIPKQPGTWKQFKGYKILSPSKISIQYRTGYGDDDLVIDITDEIRDEKLNTLLMS
jgi:hypothetical protein